MNEIITALLAKYQYEKDHARQHESHRSTVTNIVIGISGAVLGFAGLAEDLHIVHLLCGIFLILVGGYGALLSKKHYERYSLHSKWAREYDIIIGKKLPESRFSKEIHEDVLAKHKNYFGWFAEMELNLLWTGIHLLVCLLGLGLFLASLLNILKCNG